MRTYTAAILLACVLISPILAQPANDDMLTPAEWQRIDQSIESALHYLSTRQQRNGSFPTQNQGQPGVTSLCVMAFVAQGHMPGEGPYGAQLDQALRFIVSCQKSNGLLAMVFPGGSEKISRNVTHPIGSAATYNHALSGLLLSEVFAMGGGELETNQVAIERALQATLEMQAWPKRRRVDKGGWRYVNRFDGDSYDSDLSVTGWHLMFLRSAKNAGFDVPEAPIAEAVGYIQRCFKTKYDSFIHIATDQEDRRSRGMAGAGILAMAHAGMHNSQEARAAGQWLLDQGFANYNESRMYSRPNWTDDRYHYGVFCSCQAMYQLGGEYWRQFFPPAAQVILANQQPDGSWDIEDHMYDRDYGKCYTTALMALTLGAPNQLLPIFQR